MLQGVTKSDKGLEGVTTGFRDFTKFYRGLQGFSDG